MPHLYTHGQIFYHIFQPIIALALQDNGLSLSPNQWGRGDYLRNLLIVVSSTEYIRWHPDKQREVRVNRLVSSI